MRKLSYLILALTVTTTSAFAAENFSLKITNGSGMPISPGVLYVTKGQERLVEVGQAATAGFVQLCQTGNPDTRLQEVMNARDVNGVQRTPGIIPPGQSIELPFSISKNQSLQFEAMYGKTKDTCALISVSGDALIASPHTSAVIATGTDEVLTSGAFLAPRLDGSNATEASAVDRLRTLSPAATDGKVQHFSGYLPSVVNQLEERYGADETQALLLSGAGAVRYQIIRKH